MEKKELNEEVPMNEHAVSSEGSIEENKTANAVVVPEEQPEVEVEQVENFSVFTKEELVTTIESFLADQDYSIIKSKINPLRDAFNDLVSHQKQEQLEKYLETGGEKDDFEYRADALEQRFTDALKKVNKRRIEFLENQEKQREKNLAAKHDILQLLKDIIQNEENMSRAFNTFHDLQNKWRAIGPVPPKNVNDLWMTYKLYIEKFYDLIKINRELQDLDQKKNLEMKIRMCEQMEELMMEPSLNKSLSRLQTLQNQWREVGTIPRDKRTEIGERFKAASDKIVERKREYLDGLKIKHAENLKLKEALCGKVEQITVSENPSHNEFQEKTKEVLELQNEWRKTGMADKAANDEIWKRFKGTCDLFFKQKQDYYQKKKKEYQANLQAKTELCIRAEALVNSVDWRNTSVELRKLNDEWKKIGPVGAKMSDKIWNRFKSAADIFFTNKKEHFADAEKEYEGNLVKKNELIERVSQFKLGEDREQNFTTLKDFQREWTDIGLVPHDKKDEIYARFKKLIDELFNGLRLNEKEKREMQFKQKVDYLKNAANANEKISDEKRVLMNKISQLNTDVTLWENNLGFFAKSKNADQIKQEFESKINKAKSEISELKKQLQVIKTF